MPRPIAQCASLLTRCKLSQDLHRHGCLLHSCISQQLQGEGGGGGGGGGGASSATGSRTGHSASDGDGGAPSPPPLHHHHHRRHQQQQHLSSLLPQVHAACGSMECTHHVFSAAESACKRDVVAWNVRRMMLHSRLVAPSRATFLVALSACRSGASSDEGLLLHSWILEQATGTELIHDVILGTGLVSMYGRCGSVEDAWESFTRISIPDAVAWNAIISVYAQNGCGSEAIQLFQRFGQDGLMPNKVTYLVILDAYCGNAPSVRLEEGKRIHSSIWNRADASRFDISIGNALINMYNKCGSLDGATQMFDEMHERNVISWTSLISALAQHGFAIDALQAFHQMQVEGVVPNSVTLLNILPCASSGTVLAKGISIHAVLGHEAESDNVLGNALLNMYGKCDQLELAQGVFERMRDRDVVSWNTMLSARPLHSSGLLWQMQMESFLPNKATFVCLLTAYAGSAPSLTFIKGLHAQIVSNRLDADLAIATSLISIYGKHRFLDEARSMLDSSDLHDMVMFNALIASYTQNGLCRDALQLLHQSQMEGFVPDKATFLSALDACGNEGTINEVTKMHAIVTRLGLHSDTSVNNALLATYGKCGRIEEAHRIFESCTMWDVVTWNVMIMALGYSGNPGKAALLFEVMQMEGTVPDKATFASLLCVFANGEALLEGTRLHARMVASVVNVDIAVRNALITMYGRCDRLDQAQNVFDRISNPDITSWNAIIAAHVHCNEANKALCQYHNLMRSGSLCSDKVIVITILSVFASEAALADGRYLHTCIVDNGVQSDISVGNGLINMYSKSGNLEDARCVFEKMRQHDMVSWNAMIAACAQHGRVRLTFELFHKFRSKGMVPDKVTLVSILMACSHGGLVDEGFWFFVFAGVIERTIEHYNCLIDLLGRAGRLNELECVMMSMTIEPTYASWMTLLDACRKHFDLERGEVATNCIMDLEPSKCAPLVLLSNMYAHAGRWEDVNKVKGVMRGN